MKYLSFITYMHTKTQSSCKTLRFLLYVPAKSNYKICLTVAYKQVKRKCLMSGRCEFLNFLNNFSEQFEKLLRMIFTLYN